MYRRIASRLLIAYAVTLAMIATCAPHVWAAGTPIVITGGSLDARGVMGSGPLLLEGDRGFTFTGATYTGNYQPGLCPCLGGDRMSLYASWGGSWDVSGVATLDGITYPRVGDPNDMSSTASAMTVVFNGSVLLPAAGGATTIVAPFTFEATFYHHGGTDQLIGSGMARIELRPVTGYPEARWFVKEVVYRLGSRLPSPWVAQDIGVSGTAGASSLVDDTFVVAGGGTDIWGTADSFRLASLPLPGAGAVTARVVTQQKAYPSASHADAALQAFAKAGVMIRESTQPDAPSAVLDVKPNGEIEFMARYAAGEQTTYLGGAMPPGEDVWLALIRGDGGEIAAAYSLDGAAWTLLGTVSLNLHSTALVAGLAVTSHETAALNGVLFDHVSVNAASASANLLVQGDFEGYQPPALGLPGWVSDDALRQVPAKSETNQPRSGAKNGACWTTQNLDCGLYQEVVAPFTGLYSLQLYATADRTGGLVGANVNGGTAASSSVAPGGFGLYAKYEMTLAAAAGDIIRVWMYSPASRGYVVIDDATLTASTQVPALSSDEPTPPSWSTVAR